MTSKKIDLRTLDSILNKMLDTVNDSKYEIFEIGEVSQTEYEEIKKELEDVKKKVADVIYQYDSLEKRSR
ncbi:MAG TPA: histidine kinase, partial [Massilibacterium sp.]|nr:histidine kinase [Massilibacterium sp.]